MTPKEISEANEILRGVVGSTSHGTAVEDQDDRDEMGIFIEPPEYVCGLESCNHYIYRDAPEGERSKPGDLDLTMYSLRKFCRLAADGNPSILMLLWLPRYITIRTIGSGLISIRQAFVSKRAGERYASYLKRQKARLAGDLSKKVSRPELIAKYGYDTKFAMHALRLGYQGIEFLRDRHISIPVKEPQLSTLRRLRTGGFTFHIAMQLIEQAEQALLEEVDRCELEPDLDLIKKFMVRAHKLHWMKDAGLDQAS